MSDRPDSDFDKDQTAIRQVPNDDKTAIRKEKARTGDVPQTDETLVRGDQSEAGKEDATLIRGSLPEGEDSTRPEVTVVKERGATSRSATILKEPGQAGSNATILRRPAPSNDHATILRGGGVENRNVPTDVKSEHGTDATLMRDVDGGGDGDRTVMNPERNDDSTVMGDRAKGHADTTYIASVGRQIQSRGNSEAGRLLKNRFVLEEKIGSGGMGDVYKALDLRQQEAQERNPYIAIKILNENFARHKDAFISLQREATRTRGIPHQNIMAVYDFDREGDTVFMSMELLDGKPLDDYLKDHAEGVSVEDAWNIIDGICKGLSRAHGAGIVHSDFKPGNIYYTDTKIAKVFDFGIARAVSKPGELEAQGEKTVFDAGTLGALTPTYASYEMLTGKEPTKSDDVYAVALVAYELFTGRHPYNRTPADKALEKGLEPEPIPFLKRRHWKALKKGLALKGEDRFESIDEFYEGMFSEDPPYFRYASIAALILISIGFGAYSLLREADQVPQELTNLQGILNANMNNLSERLGRLENEPMRDNWSFNSSEWREEVDRSLTRIVIADRELRETFPDYYVADPRIDQWKQRVLDAYLAEIKWRRQQADNITTESINLEENLASVQSALSHLRPAQEYLAYLKESQAEFGFTEQAIQEEESYLITGIQTRELKESSIQKEIDDAEARRLAAEAEAEQRRIEAELIAQRNAHYLGLLDEFRNILRCKGNISDAELDALNVILNGPTGLQATFPEQFEVDKPGLVHALQGCIADRIGVRAPDRAREVKARVVSMLPDAPLLADIVIEDLDPCALRSLEGKGNRNGSWCSDRLAVGGVGPELVVIPKSGPTAQKFAISRIEIKVSDYNQFCEAMGCEVIQGPGTIPVTNIPLSQAEAYASWLSDQTGKAYRLPTMEEWLHAARTDVDEPLDDNINCTVDSRGVRLGEKLLSTLSGRPNTWGLYNYVGNAREWALADDSVVALGGAHTDPKSECTLGKSVAHSGSPDPVTGFRIVRRVEG